MINRAMEWKRQSDGGVAPGHERFVAVPFASGSRDDRYVISRPAGGEEVGYVALFEAMYACTDTAACFDFRQDVCPVCFSTLETAKEACQTHTSCGKWPGSV